MQTNMNMTLALASLVGAASVASAASDYTPAGYVSLVDAIENETDALQESGDYYAIVELSNGVGATLTAEPDTVTGGWEGKGSEYDYEWLEDSDVFLELNEMLEIEGSSEALTYEDLELGVVAPNSADATNSILTLNFGADGLFYEVGDVVTIYFTVTSAHAYEDGDTIEISGLENVTVYYADSTTDYNITTTTGLTFQEEDGVLTFVKITGTLTDLEVAISTTNSMDGYGIIAVSRSGKTDSEISAWEAVPEPSTATLSLLALAGIMARRRRK